MGVQIHVEGQGVRGCGGACRDPSSENGGSELVDRVHAPPFGLDCNTRHGRMGMGTQRPHLLWRRPATDGPGLQVGSARQHLRGVREGRSGNGSCDAGCATSISMWGFGSSVPWACSPRLLPTAGLTCRTSPANLAHPILAPIPTITAYPRRPSQPPPPIPTSTPSRQTPPPQIPTAPPTP